MRCRLTVLALVFAVAAVPALAQSGAPPLRDSTVAVHMRDGGLLVGRITEQSVDSIGVVTASGRMTLARSAIVEIAAVNTNDVHEGVYWPTDPHDTRLFFGPTGRVLGKKNCYFSDLYLFLVNVACGVTDRLMLGGGMSLFPSSDFLGNNLYYLTPKVALVQREAFNVSVGALVGFAGHTAGSSGMLYAAATNGRPDLSFTYGVGYVYSQDKITSDALLMFGGNARISRRVSLMSENYIFTGRSGGYFLPIYGVRLIGDKLSTDLGFVNFFGRDVAGIFPGLPWVGMAIKF